MTLLDHVIRHGVLWIGTLVETVTAAQFTVVSSRRHGRRRRYV